MSGLLLGLESYHAAAETGEILKEELKTLKTHVETLPLTTPISQAALGAIAATGKSELATVAKLVSKIEKTDGPLPGAGDFNPTTNEISDFPVLVGAQAYTIITQAEKKTDPCFIHVNARGDGSGDNGDLFVTASRSIDMRVAQGLFALSGGKSK